MSEYIVRITDDMPYEIKAELNAWYIESEPIVRCRDCVYFIENASTMDMDGNVIGSGPVCEWLELWVKPNGFCAWGERKVDE